MIKFPEFYSPHETVITQTDQITPEWLNQILEKQYFLKENKVRNVSVDYIGSTNAHIARLCVNYETDSKELPKNLLLKMCKSENDFIKDSEVNYYARDYKDLPNAPIPQCYDAQFSAHTNAYHILMEDLSETHHKDAEPTVEYGESVADALALLHSHGWGDKIESLGGHMLNQETIEQYVNHARPGLKPMLEVFGGVLDDEAKEVIQAVFDHYSEKFAQRAQNRQGFAVVHGDTNPGNILFPNDPKGKTYLLDRQPFNWSLTTSLAVSDLSYMMVPFWETEQRRALEMPTLKRYHDQLQKHGIADYSWDQLLDDYKLTAMQGIFIAVAWCIGDDERKNMEWLWKAELKRALYAYTDLESEKVLAD